MPDTELTAEEQEALASGWPDFWQVHAAVKHIIAARVETVTAERDKWRADFGQSTEATCQALDRAEKAEADAAHLQDTVDHYIARMIAAESDRDVEVGRLGNKIGEERAKYAALVAAVEAEAKHYDEYPIGTRVSPAAVYQRLRAVLADHSDARAEHGDTSNDATGFIKALVGAWDCCGTCAGSVLARHDARVRREALLEAADAPVGLAPWTRDWLRARARIEGGESDGE